MPNRIAETFARLRTPAFIPFFTVGDPDLAASEALVREAAARGADLIELGVPFSDPVADGPTIQASYTRALERGFRVAQLFELARRLRAGGLAAPLVCMVSETLVFRRSVPAFLDAARDAGLDGLIIPDLPAGYEGDTAEQAAARALSLIFLCAPTTTDERRARVVNLATGFVYYISVAGITGARTALPPDLAVQVRDLKARTRTPVCVGFGISRPDQAAAVAQVADGVIVGSALVKLVGELSAQGLSGAALVQAVSGQLAALAQAVHQARVVAS